MDSPFPTSLVYFVCCLSICLSNLWLLSRLKWKKNHVFSLMFSSSGWIVQNMPQSHGRFLFPCLGQNWMPASWTCTPPVRLLSPGYSLSLNLTGISQCTSFLENVVTSLLKTIVSPLFLGWSSDFLMWPHLTPLMPGDLSLTTLLHSLWRSQTNELLSVFWMYRDVSYLQDLLCPNQ